MAQAIGEVSVETLIDLELLHKESVGKLRKHGTLSQDAFESIVRDGTVPSEPQVTRFLACTGGRLEEAVIRYLLAAAQSHQSVEGLFLLTGTQFGHLTKRRRRRSADLIVVSGDEETGIVPVLIVEAKYSADVNGRWGYCPADSSIYSNQAMCYSHGCLYEAGGYRLVWLGHAEHQSVEFPWGNGGLTTWHRDHPSYATAYDAQSAAAADWYRATWEGLAAAIEAEIGGQEAAVISRILLRTKV